MGSLQSDILRLLKEDETFRYAVLGLLGYDTILRRLEEHDRKFNAILERLDKHTSILEEHTAILQEHTKRLEEHDRKFNAILEELSVHRAKLEEHDKKFNEVVIELRDLRKVSDEHTRILQEHTKLLEEHTRILQEHTARFDRIDKRLDDINKSVGSISEKFGFILEDIAVTKLPMLLAREGISIDRADIKARYPIVVNDKEIEVDIYVEGKINGKMVKVVGEVKGRIDRSDVERFYRRFKGYDAFKFIFAHIIRPAAEHKARELGIRLYATYS